MKKFFFSLSFLLIFCFVGTCLAIDDFTVTETGYDAETGAISAIINDNRVSGESFDGVTASIDDTELTETGFQPLNETDVPFTFCFVVDTTTTSIVGQKKVPGEIAKILSESRSGKKDEYILISYDEEVHEPVGPSRFANNVLDGLNYDVKAEGDYSAALVQAVELLDGMDNFSKKVIILITDGRLVAEPTLSSSALEYLMEAAGYPVYAYGLKQSESDLFVTSNLEKLDQLSQITGGLYFSASDVTDTAAAGNFMDHMNQSVLLTGNMSVEYISNAAGSVPMNIVLRQGENEIAQINAVIDFPEAEEAEIEGSGETPEETEVIETEPTPEPTFIDKIKSALGPNWMLIVIAALLVAALIVLILITAAKPKKEEEAFEEINDDLDANEGGRSSVQVMLIDRGNKRTITAEIEEGQKQIFGRSTDKTNGVIGLNGDPHISRKQFMITNGEQGLYIEDMGSENGTYLNDQRIRGKVKVSGGKLRVGNVAGEREFEIRVS